MTRNAEDLRGIEELVQIDTPEDVVRAPTSAFVARFLSDATLVDGVVADGTFTSGSLTLEAEGSGPGTLAILPPTSTSCPDLRATPVRSVAPSRRRCSAAMRATSWCTATTSTSAARRVGRGPRWARRSACPCADRSSIRTSVTGPTDLAIPHLATTL